MSQEVIARLLKEPTDINYTTFSLIGSSCMHIHVPRFTDEEFLFILHAITFISSLLNLMAFYCICFKSSETMGNFKWCLLTLQFWSCLTDIMVSVLVVPRFYFPVIGGKSNGIFMHLGISIPWQISLGFGSFGAMVASVTLLFFYRHQVTVDANSFWRFRKELSVFMITVNYFLYMNVMTPPLLTSPDDQLAGKIEVLRRTHCPPKDILHERVYILQSSFDIMMPWFVFMVLFVAVQCGLCAYHCAHILLFSTLKRKLSRKTRKMQLKFFFSLFWQIAIPTTLGYCPIFYYAITTIIDHYWQFANDICVLIISSHGTLSALCLLLFYDCYRDHLLSIVCARWVTGKFKNNRSNENSVHSVHVTTIL